MTMFSARHCTSCDDFQGRPYSYTPSSLCSQVCLTSRDRIQERITTNTFQDTDWEIALNDFSLSRQCLHSVSRRWTAILLIFGYGKTTRTFTARLSQRLLTHSLLVLSSLTACFLPLFAYMDTDCGRTTPIQETTHSAFGWTVFQRIIFLWLSKITNKIIFGNSRAGWRQESWKFLVIKLTQSWTGDEIKLI